ncbi:unnamed protein product [Didymodactylos carnosus]|uniref:Uncharacterized protein n=1 Tax=Didymodactylos carnosus TaxID=1234261 RepID=A0A8S2EA46_9BILA|nr:unnamed protein product [Didymodactylos carnosus]CAF3983046.1 unnamed protein product [Didymodactylos carnosus]
MYSAVLTAYGECALIRFRYIERKTIKLVKAQCDIEFLRYCLIHSLTPKFVRFKLSNKKLQNSSKVKAFQRQLLTTEYIQKLKVVKNMKQELNTLSDDEFYKQFSIRHKYRFKAYLVDLQRSETERISNLHEKKLSNLLGVVCDHTTSKMLDIEKLVYNLSDKELTHPQLKLLGRGWKFCIEQKMNETLNVKTEIEYGMQIIKQKIPEGNPSWIKICDQIKIIANDMLKRTERNQLEI